MGCSEREDTKTDLLEHARVHRKVADVHPGPREEVDVPGDAGEPPGVLVLEVGAVAPAEHQHADHRRPTHLDHLGDLELGWQLGVLRVAHLGGGGGDGRPSAQPAQPSQPVSPASGASQS